MKRLTSTGWKFGRGRRIREHLKDLRGPEREDGPAESNAAPRFFVSGGTLPPDTASYLERGADRALFHSLRSGNFCYVLNSRQLGKSSLSVRTISRLEQAGVRTAFLDLTRIGGKNLTAEQWYAALAFELGRELSCIEPMLAYWKKNSAAAPVQRFFSAVRDVALSGSSDGGHRPLVVFIDEIDATRSLPFDADEFFAAIRECYNRRVSDPSLQRLAFCLLGVAVPSDLVRNRATTPFNIGERIFLDDFSESELAPFQAALGPNGAAVIKRIHYWTAGHPFLSQSLCRSISASPEVTTPGEVDEVVRRELFDYRARETNINLADVANIALHYREESDSFRADLLSTYLRILEGGFVADDESNRVIVVLKLSGIVKSDGRRLRVRNRIYENVFDRAWIEEHMPEQELRRQRQSYRRGAWRTGAIAGSIVLFFGAAAAIAWTSRMQAISTRNRLDYELYVADMNSLSVSYQVGDTARIEEVLARYQSAPYRGFEWGFWLSRFHEAKEEYTLNYNAPGKREIGHLSTDGNEICIEDQLTQTATVLTRATKRVVATVKLKSGQHVSPSRDRWLLIEELSDGVSFRDLLTGREIGHFHVNRILLRMVQHREHSNYAVLAYNVADAGPEAARVAIWDISAGELLRNLQFDSRSELIEITEDGKILVRSKVQGLGTKDGDQRMEVEVMSLADNHVIDRYTIPPSRTVAFSRNGEWLISQSSNDHRLLRMFGEHRTVDLGASAGPFLGDSFPVDNDDHIIGPQINGRCSLRDLGTGRSISERRSVFAVLPGVANDEYLASAGTVRVFRTSDPVEPQPVGPGIRLTHHEGSTVNVFGEGGKVLAYISDETFQAAGKNARGNVDYGISYNGRWKIVNNPDGKPGVLTSTEGRWPAIPLPFNPVNWSCGLSPDHIALWRPEEAIAVYSGLTKKMKWTSSTPMGVEGMWMSPDSSRLLVIRDGVTLTVFDPENGRRLLDTKAHNVGPVRLTFTSDGERFFTCGGDGRVVMWDLRSLRPIKEFRGNDQEQMTSADLSPDGRRVVTSNTGGTWQLWDAQSGVQFMNITASDRPLNSALFSRDGKRILTAGDDRTVRAWSSKDKDPTSYIPIDVKHLAGLRR